MANTNDFFNANQSPEWGDYEVSAKEEITPTKTKAEIYREQIPNTLNIVKRSLENPIYGERSKDYYEGKDFGLDKERVVNLKKTKENDFPYEITFDRKGRPFADVNGYRIPLDEYNAPEMIEEEEYVYPNGRPTSTNQFTRPMLNAYTTLATNDWLKTLPEKERFQAVVKGNKVAKAIRKFGRSGFSGYPDDPQSTENWSYADSVAKGIIQKDEAKAQKAAQLKALMNEFTDEEIAQIMGGE